MGTVWFMLVALMLGGYVLLDGFDLGVGAIYLLVAKTERERRAALQAIGPVWDGNEVWLLTGGGLLFFAFPHVYAAAFSGFYLALFLALWLLVLRGLSLELRSKLDHPLWRSFWDGIFSLSSLLLALVFGAALGNVLRGVPLNAEGYFFTPLWTYFVPGVKAGILDWYTVLVGLLAVVTLAVHGANYLVLKTDGQLQRRARRLAGQGLWGIVVLAVVAVALTPWVQPLFAQRYNTHPVGLAIPLAAALALAGMAFFQRQTRELAPFLASGLFILVMLLTAAYGLFPNLLIATTDPAYSLTIDNAAAPLYGLQVGLVWFALGSVLILGYTVFVYRSFWGKVEVTIGEGY